MLLVLTNSSDATADYLIGRLDRWRASIVRLDTDVLLQDARFSVQNDTCALDCCGRTLRPCDVSVVWNRRPEPLRVACSADSQSATFIRNEWSESLEAFLAHIPSHRWMNHSRDNAAASNKIYQLTLAKGCGLEVPATLVTQEPCDVRRFAKRYQSIISKPIGSGHLDATPDRGEGLVFTSRVSAEDLVDLQDLANCPTLFQEEIHRECDLRVTYVDGSFTTVALTVPEEALAASCDVRRNNMSGVRYEAARLPGGVRSALEKMLSKMKLRFAAIDLLVDKEGRSIFLEVNPNGQWAWLDIVGPSAIWKDFERAFFLSENNR